jgi:hypothetical protein
MEPEIVLAVRINGSYYYVEDKMEDLKDGSTFTREQCDNCGCAEFIIQVSGRRAILKCNGDEELKLPSCGTIYPVVRHAADDTIF